jgi:hypothetical protein
MKGLRDAVERSGKLIEDAAYQWNYERLSGASEDGCGCVFCLWLPG